MKASDYIVQFLEEQGIEYVFGYQGGMITHLVDSLGKSHKVRFIQCYHEQSAAFAAEGYARVSGKFGVCITTSGPGATNAITGIGNAFFDSVPVLYITGQVNTYNYKFGRKLRQLGFQETDIVSITRPITKWAKFIMDARELPDCLENALSTMLFGRRGPVLLDLPMDVQRSDIDVSEAPLPSRERNDVNALSRADIKRVLDDMTAARRPLVLCGGGLANAELRQMAARFLRRSGLPYVVSLMGKGNVDETDGNFIGMIGSYGNRAANCILAEADVVLCLGSRLDSRQTGNRDSRLLRNKRFIRIDLDEDELIDNPMPTQIGIVADLRSFLADAEVAGFHARVSDEWTGRIRFVRETRSQSEDVMRFAKNKLPYEVLAAVSEIAPEDAVFTVDVGQNQMWSAQTVVCSLRRLFLTSGGMAPMGYAIPAAVGAAFADGTRHVVCLCGDGGFHIALQSLMLIRQYSLKVTIVVFNNHSLGMITQFQNLYFSGNMLGTTEDGGYLVPDISAIARAYGLQYRHIHAVAEMSPQWFGESGIVEIDIPDLTTVVPKLEYNKDLDDMAPEWRIEPDV